MTKFENLMEDSNRLESMAMESKDNNLRAFYHNASIGFKERAINLTIEEAETEGYAY